MKPTPCPCGHRERSGRVRERSVCCGPFLDGEALAPDAPTLMRSRYSAFVERNTGYLLVTWHPSTRPSGLVLDPAVRWLGLELRQDGVGVPGQAWVEFVARSREQGRGQRLHERSRFVAEQGRWYYLDGVFL